MEWKAVAEKLLDEYIESHSMFLALYDIKEYEAFKGTAQSLQDAIHSETPGEILQLLGG